MLRDGLRASICFYMIENITKLSAALGPNLTEVIIADVPDNVRFGSLEDRIMHMSNATASVGELEIVSTAQFLQKTIVVVEEQFQQISVCKPRDAVSHDQSKLGPSIGHFNAVLVDREHLQQAPNSNSSSKHPQQLVIPTPQPASAPLTVIAQDILPFPKKIPYKSPIIIKRNKRCQQAELITSSPVKQRLKRQCQKS